MRDSEDVDEDVDEDDFSGAFGAFSSRPFLPGRNKQLGIKC